MTLTYLMKTSPSAVENSLQAAQAAVLGGRWGLELMRQQGRWERQDFRGTWESREFAGAPDGHVEEGEASRVDRGFGLSIRVDRGSVSCQGSSGGGRALRGIRVQLWTENRWDK